MNETLQILIKGISARLWLGPSSFVGPSGPPLPSGDLHQAQQLQYQNSSLLPIHSQSCHYFDEMSVFNGGSKGAENIYLTDQSYDSAAEKMIKGKI